MSIVDFLRAKPKVEYTHFDNKKGYYTKVWEFRWTGMFGQGYYQLTKNGRRHPLSNFKVIQQVYNEYMDMDYKLVEEKVAR